jgi:hypothetical protein
MPARATLLQINMKDYAHTLKHAHRHGKNTQGASGCPHVPAPRVQDAGGVSIAHPHIAKQKALKKRAGNMKTEGANGFPK